MICYGDFNICYREFVDSGWCDQLSVIVKVPKGDSTLKNTSNRIIDFVLVSRSFDCAISNLELVVEVPWGPHFGAKTPPKTT